MVKFINYEHIHVTLTENFFGATESFGFTIAVVNLLVLLVLGDLQSGLKHTLATQVHDYDKDFSNPSVSVVTC
jgi:hypothetical protein